MLKHSEYCRQRVIPGLPTSRRRLPTFGEVPRHIPDPGTHLLRYYRMYSNRMVVDRARDNA
jgi:hypothetical protein